MTLSDSGKAGSLRESAADRGDSWGWVSKPASSLPTSPTSRATKRSSSTTSNGCCIGWTTFRSISRTFEGRNDGTRTGELQHDRPQWHFGVGTNRRELLSRADLFSRGLAGTSAARAGLPARSRRECGGWCCCHSSDSRTTLQATPGASMYAPDHLPWRWAPGRRHFSRPNLLDRNLAARATWFLWHGARLSQESNAARSLGRGLIQISSPKTLSRPFASLRGLANSCS